MIATAQCGEAAPAAVQLPPDHRVFPGGAWEFENRALSQVAPLSATLPRGLATVLLVESEEHMREALTGVLQAQGYHVLPVSGPEEARRLVEESPALELALLNLTDPKRADLELAAWFQTACPDIRIIVATNCLWDVSLQLADRPDLVFLSQPYSAQKLGTLLREVLPEPDKATVAQAHCEVANA